MNRQQRRTIAKKKLTDKDIKAIEENIKAKTLKDAIDFAVKNYMACVALCLHDKLGFGHDRTCRFMRDVDNLFDSINKGYLSLDDVLKTVKEEIGIMFERKKQK